MKEELKIEVGEEVIFRAPDGYPARARFFDMHGDKYHLRSNYYGDFLATREDIMDIVRPKPVAYSEVPMPREP